MTPDKVTLILAVPSINKALRDEVSSLGLTLPASATGYHLVEGLSLRLLVMDLGAVSVGEGDDLLGWFAGLAPGTLDARRWVRQHLDQEGSNMSMNATPDLEGYEEFVARTMAMFTPAQRLAGLASEEVARALTPAQRLAGLAPAQRLAGLSAEDVVLALPDEVLRSLPDTYIAGLPEEIQSAVRARRGR